MKGRKAGKLKCSNCRQLLSFEHVFSSLFHKEFDCAYCELRLDLSHRPVYRGVLYDIGIEWLLLITFFVLPLLFDVSYIIIALIAILTVTANDLLRYSRLRSLFDNFGASESEK